MKMLLRLRCLTIALTTAALFLLAAPAIWADDDDDVIEFEEAHVFFELNNTDGDLGIHSLIDGEPWKKVEFEDPRGREILDVTLRGRLRRQGLTEFFFESAEPTFDELPPRKFFRRFPEGEYEIEGRTLEGDEIEGSDELTHLIPAPPLTRVTGMNGTFAEDDDCDDVDIAVTPPVTIEWDPVLESHDELGSPKSAPIIVHNYEVVVETEVDLNGDELTVVSSTILPPDATELTIPAEFIALGDEFKYEVLVREESFNQTAIESCFEVN